MNRGVITISESGTVSMPTDTVWMTMQEIADMYNVFGYYVRKAVKAVFKDGILKEQGVRRHVRKNDRISYDVYSLELVIAVAFRIDSIAHIAAEYIIHVGNLLHGHPYSIGRHGYRSALTDCYNTSVHFLSSLFLFWSVSFVSLRCISLSMSLDILSSVMTA